MENQHSVSIWSPTANSTHSSPLPFPEPLRSSPAFPSHSTGMLLYLGAFWQRHGVAFRGKIGSLIIQIHFQTTKPPLADFLFTEMVGVLFTDQAAILDYLHFSLMHFALLCSTLPSFLSNLFIARLSHINQCYGLKLSVL